MRNTRIIFVLCALMVVAGLAWFLVVHAHSNEKRLSDGSIIKVEKVAFGKQEHFMLGGRFTQLLQKMPLFVRKYFSKTGIRTGGGSTWTMVSLAHTNDKALYVYISRRNGMSGKYQNVAADTAQLIDEHGCVLENTVSGGWDDGLLPMPTGSPRGPQGSVGWFRFEAFPRRESSFRIRLYERNWRSGEPGSIAEFVIANPAPPPPKNNWLTEPLPVTKSMGGVSFALTNVVIRSNPGDKWTRAFHPQTVDADFAVTEDGRASSNWLALKTELFDSDGNFASDMERTARFLCPHVEAWKYRVSFFGDENSHAASNAVWIMRGLEVPGEGKFILLQKTNELQGVPLLVGALGGPGIYSFSNCVPLKAEPRDDSADAASSKQNDPWDRNSANTTSWPRSWRGGRFGPEKPTYRVDARDAYLALDFGQLSDDQRLTVRIIDDQGREFYAGKMGGYVQPGSRNKRPQPEDYLENGQASDPPFLLLNLPKDSRKVDIYFCVHTCYAPEFIFKPPPLEARAVAQ